MHQLKSWQTLKFMKINYHSLKKKKAKALKLFPNTCYHISVIMTAEWLIILVFMTA